MLRSRISIGAAVLSMLWMVACGGPEPRSRGIEEGVVTLDGTVSKRGGTPFGIVVIKTANGEHYNVEPSAIGDELARLDGMNVSVVGSIVDTGASQPMLVVQSYEILQLPSGEMPIVGTVETGDQPQSPVWLVDDNLVRWLITGDFKEVFRSFAGAKVWVVGVKDTEVNDGSGSSRSLHITEYGVIRR